MKLLNTLLIIIYADGITCLHQQSHREHLSEWHPWESLGLEFGSDF